MLRIINSTFLRTFANALKRPILLGNARLSHVNLPSTVQFSFSMTQKQRSASDSTNEKQEDSDILFQDNQKSYENVIKNADKYIRQFPFAQIPSKFHLNFEKVEIQKQKKWTLLMLSMLIQTRRDSQMNKFNEKFHVLFPDYVNKSSKLLEHEEIMKFISTFYETRVDKMVIELNSSETSFEKKCQILNLFQNLPFTNESKNFFEKIDEDKLFEKDDYGILRAYYLGLLQRFGKQLKKILPVLQQKVKKNDNQNEDKNIIIAKIFLTKDLYKTIQKFNPSIFETCIKALTNKVSTLADWQLYIVLRKIYGYRGQANKELLTVVQNRMLKKKKEEINHQLLFQVIKVKQSIRLRNTNFYDYFNKNIQFTEELLMKDHKRFDHVFAVFKENKKLNGEISPKLTKIMTKFLDQITVQLNANTVNDKELILQLQNLWQYPQIFPKDNIINFMEALYKSKISPVSTNEEILYNSLLFYDVSLLYFKEEADKFKAQLTTLTKKILISLTQKNDKGSLIVKKDINKVIKAMNIAYFHRISKEVNKFPLIFQFRSLDTEHALVLYKESLSAYFHLLMHMGAPIEEKQASVKYFEPNIIIYLRKGIVNNLNTIYALLNALEKIQYDSKYLYNFIEHSISRIIQSSTKSNKQFKITKENILTMKTKMINLGYGSPNLTKFITQAINKYQNFEELRDLYISNERFYTTEKWKKDDAKKAEVN